MSDSQIGLAPRARESAGVCGSRHFVARWRFDGKRVPLAPNCPLYHSQGVLDLDMMINQIQNIEKKALNTLEFNEGIGI